MDMTLLMPTDFPLVAGQATLYQKITLQFWKERIANECRYDNGSTYKEGTEDAPEVVSDG